MEAAPWVVTEEFLTQHAIDYVAHDALPYSDATGQGTDVYETVRPNPTQPLPYHVPAVPPARPCAASAAQAWIAWMPPAPRLRLPLMLLASQLNSKPQAKLQGLRRRAGKAAGQVPRDAAHGGHQHLRRHPARHPELQ